MDHLWSPWRYQYIRDAGPSTGCVFCDKLAENRDAENYIVYRGIHNFIILNLYPYTTGHLMVAPYLHVARLAETPNDTLTEMMLLAKQCQSHLGFIYKPDGFNMGMNMGESAGAGIASHIHLHLLPRWTGDANFMSVIGETRVMPEELPATYRKLAQAFATPAAP